MMATLTIDQTESIPIEFELERLETRYAQPRSEIYCGGCEGCTGCSGSGCKGCESCAIEEPGL